MKQEKNNQWKKIMIKEKDKKDRLTIKERIMKKE